MKIQTKLLNGLKLASITSITAALYSCGPMPNYAPSAMAPAPVVESNQSRNAMGGAADTVAAPKVYAKKVVQQRPGIATGWGNEIQSNVRYGSFNRSSKRPSNISSIYYNDKEGIEAMTSSWRYSGKGMQKAANGMVEWGVKSGWSYLKNVHSNGKRFVVGSKGRNYALVVKNVAHSALELVLSVDGLDVLDGKSASLKKRGYIIQPGKTLVVKGFRKSEDAVAAFNFSSVRNSYSNQTNQGTRNIGVIGMAVYTQKGVNPWRYGSTEIKNRTGARAFAEAPSVRAR